jgi:hypothetical protein
LHCRVAAKKEFLTNAQKEQRMAFATAYTDKDSNGGSQSSLVLKKLSGGI